MSFEGEAGSGCERQTLADDLVRAARAAREEGLVVSTSGNISVRLDDGSFLISAARTRLGHLQRNDLVRVSIATGETLQAGAASRPSRETPMHRAAYAACDGIGSVLHCQSPNATVLAASVEPLPDLRFIPEVPVYVQKARAVPYLTPGSVELGNAVARHLAEPSVHVVQLGNHGQLVVGPRPLDAVERATFFELACRIWLLAKGRVELRRYTEDETALLASYGRPPPEDGSPGQ